MPPPADLLCLFIYTDDQRWDAMGVMQREQGKQARFPWFETPQMDRLAAEGVRCCPHHYPGRRQGALLLAPPQ